MIPTTSAWHCPFARPMVATCLILVAWSAAGAEPQREFRTPVGIAVQKVAGAPLVRYPLFACFDDRGRLFVAEGTGTNLPGPELETRLLGKITVLEDRDGDGRFDHGATFADKLVFPQGEIKNASPAIRAFLSRS